MRFILIRHGETDHNVENRMSGWTEATLSARGAGQARSLAKRLEHVAVHRLITSGMERAGATAAIVFPHSSKSAETMVQLKEMNFGTMEGLTMDEIKDEHSEVFMQLQKMVGEYVFPEGESLVSFHKRIQSAALELLKLPDDESIAVVAHSGTIRCLLAGWIANDWRAHWKFRIDHCSVTIVDFYDGYPVLRLCNDTAHLYDPLATP